MKEEIKINPDLEERKQEGCRHLFTLSRIDTEQTNQGAGNTGYFYQKIAYVVCEKCGETIKQLI